MRTATRSVPRSLAVVTAALATAATAVVAMPPAVADTPDRAVADTPDRRAACPYPVSRNEFIADRWADLGGRTGRLGCAIRPTVNVTVGGVWKGKRQQFENGQITWSPSQGGQMVLAAWERRGYAFADWGPTTPFRYDRFLVRYYSANDPQGTQTRHPGGTWGRTAVRKHTTGSYRFIVEGCDSGRFGLVCRQGWTLSASTR